MWTGVILAISESIAATVMTDVSKSKIDAKRTKRNIERLNSECKEKFEAFADSSLDTDSFYRFIESGPFNEMLRSYLFDLSKETKNEYLNFFVSYICCKCPGVKSFEVRDFIQRIEEVYIRYLEAALEVVPALKELYEIIGHNQKAMLSSILETQRQQEYYLQSLELRKAEIDDDDIKQYHSVCEKKYGVIRFTGIERAEKENAQQLSEFYVKNTFTPYYINRSHELRREEKVKLDLQDLFALGNKIVLVGGAGYGKSTTLNYLFCYYEGLYHVEALKLKIDLKEYAKAIAERNDTILWCFAKEFEKKVAKVAINQRDWESVLSEYLQQGRCLLIFDALDEITNEAYRTKVRDEIADFCNVYFYNRFIISTREVGYLHNKFDTDFIHVRINPFDGKQILQYCNNWLKMNLELDESEHKDFVEHFNQEVRRANCEELIKNPIILVLALIIFNHKKNLPHCRVDFYEGCIKTFLETREKQKNLGVSEKAQSILSDNCVIPKVAYYKFTQDNDDQEYIFTYKELQNAIITALEIGRHQREWITVIREFCDYLINRTELIRETDEKKYDFAHKTFYEYFLAFYFLQEYEVVDYIELLDKWIGTPDYHELVRLMVEMTVRQGSRQQKEKTINWLLNLTSSQYEKNSNKMSILSDLYSRKMLLIKYHSQYHRSIIRNWSLITTRRIVMRYSVSCDYDQLAEAYWELYDEMQEQSFAPYIFAMTAFNRKVAYTIKNKQRGRLNEIVQLALDNITCENVSLVLFLNSVEKNISNCLINPAFTENEFVSHTPPFVLEELCKSAFLSKENIILFLISVIYYGCEDNRRANHEQLIKWLINKANKKYIDNIITMWEELFCCSNFTEWKDFFIIHSLYDDKYDEWYYRLYLGYFSKETTCWEDNDWDWKKNEFNRIERQICDYYEKEQMPDRLNEFINSRELRKERRQLSINSCMELVGV